MVRDFITLLRVEWKRGKAAIRQGLELIGYDPRGNRFYPVYFGLFWAFWAFAMWSFSVEQVYQFSVTLPETITTRLMAGMPPLIFVLQVFYLTRVLYEEPLKSGEAPLAYVAFSPVNRASIVMLGFIRTLIVPALFIGVISCFLSMLMTWHSAPHAVGAAGLGALFTAILLTYLSAAIAWALALWKINSGRRGWIFWLSIPVSIGAAILLPDAIFFPGHMWQGTATLTLTAVDVIEFAVIFAVAIEGLVVIGNRVHMSTIADASQTYVRIQRLGVFGRWFAPDVMNSLAQEKRLARHQTSSVKLAQGVTGYRVLWHRALLALRRLLPGSVLQPIFVGSSLTAMITTIVRVGGWQAIQSWAMVLLILCIIRLRGITLLFRQDTTRPFLRQMIPVNNLTLFIADASYIILLTAVGSLSVILLQPWNAPPPILLIVALLSVTALGLAQAMELVEDRLILHRGIPFEYSVLLGGGMVIIIGVALHSLWGAVGGLLVINLIFSILLYYSRPI